MDRGKHDENAIYWKSVRHEKIGKPGEQWLEDFESNLVYTGVRRWRLKESQKITRKR